MKKREGKSNEAKLKFIWILGKSIFLDPKYVTESEKEKKKKNNVEISVHVCMDFDLLCSVYVKQVNKSE